MPDLNENATRNATSDVRIARQLGTLRLASIREVIKRYGFAAPSRREAEGSAVRARAWCGRAVPRVGLPWATSSGQKLSCCAAWLLAPGPSPKEFIRINNHK